MAATFIEVSGIEVTTDYIIIEALDQEKLLFAEDLWDEQIEIPSITYRFERKSAGHMKYLLRVLKGNKQAKNKKSLGQMLDSLTGQFIMLNSSFIVNA